jgi:UMF1 family MFS transporter
MTSDATPQAPEQIQPPITRKEILGWCMYDVADSAFTTVIVTVLYAVYFTGLVAGETGYGDSLWALANSASGVAVALLAPVLGAIADFSGARKRFLGLCAVVIVVFTASLYFVKPGMVVLGLVLYIIANIGFTGGGIFIDSFLPSISNEQNVGRISGTKWAFGYASGLVCLSLCIPLATGLRDDATPEQVDAVRWIPVLVAAYYAVAVIPTFVLLRERSVRQPLPPGKNYVTFAFTRLGQTFRHIRRYGDLFKLFIAFLIYNEGINTVIAFSAIYAATTIEFSPSEVIRLFIVTNVIAVGGALGFGLLADRIGQKRTIAITLVIWIVAVTFAYFAYSKEAFWVVGVLAGIGMGSTQSVTRSLVARFVPPAQAAEFFGFLGISGKAISFIGVNVFGAISVATGSQRPAILSIGVFFVAGLIMLWFVDEARGKAASRIPVDAP